MAANTNQTKGPLLPTLDSASAITFKLLEQSARKKGLNARKASRAICGWLRIPCPTRRSGLKRLYYQYDGVCDKLEAAHQCSSGDADTDRGIRAGVASFCSMMAADAILCKKMCHDGRLGVVAKAMALLSVDSTRHFALRLIATLVQNGSFETRKQLINDSLIATLSALAGEYRTDTTLCDLVTFIFYQPFLDVPAIYDGIAMKSGIQILATAIECITSDASPQSCIVDGLLAASAILGPQREEKWRSDLVQACPIVLDILIAGIRSPTWESRATCVKMLLSIHGVLGVSSCSPEVSAADDNPSFQYLLTLAALPGKLGGPWRKIVRGLMRCPGGWVQCTSYVAALVPWQLLKAFRDFRNDRDAAVLATVLYDLILSTEFAIPKDGEDKAEFGCHPFPNYADALPSCADALRLRGLPNDAIKAEVLEITFKVKRGQIDSALRQTCEARATFPNVAYFRLLHLVLHRHRDPLEAYYDAALAKQCQDSTSTDFVKTKILAIATEKAVLAGLSRLLEFQGEDSPNWTYGHAFFAIGMDHALQFMKRAPPLHLDRARVFAWYLIAFLTLTTSVSFGSWKQDLYEDEVQPYVEFCQEGLGIDPFHWPITKVLAMLMDTFPRAISRYWKVFQGLGNGEPLEGPPLDDTTRLLAEAARYERSQPLNHPQSGCKELRFSTYPRISANRTEFYICSFCTKPSAILRKCSACKKARYCSRVCQRSDWSDHKQDC